MVKPQEKRWVLIFAIIVMGITSIPYLYGFFRQGTDWFFTGFVFGVEDGNSYIAKMLSGSFGDWLFKTPYTNFQQVGFLAFLPYILLGKLAAPPGEHEQLIALFHVFRWIGGILCIMATYDFIAVFINDVRFRRIGTAMACIGGGLGWLSILGLKSLGQFGLPLDFYSPESFGFLSIFGLPHLAFGRALLLWGFVLLFRSINEINISWKFTIGVGMLWLLLGLMQPLTIVIGWLVYSIFLGIYGLQLIIKSSTGIHVTWGIWKKFCIELFTIVLISSPIVIYTIIRFQSDPYLIEWARQNLIISPPIFDYLVAYGWVLPFVFLGVKNLLRNNPVSGWMIVGWTAAFPFLAYFPNNLQRRFPEAIWVPICILILSAMTDVHRPKIRKFLFILTLAFGTPVLLFVGGIVALNAPGMPLFRPANEVMAFKFLASRSVKGEVVLSSYDVANALPAWGPMRTVIGHGPESIHLSETREKATRFFSSSLANDQYRINFLDEYGINYVYWGPDEKALGDWDPGTSNFLNQIYEENGIEIYQVKR